MSGQPKTVEAIAWLVVDPEWGPPMYDGERRLRGARVNRATKTRPTSAVKVGAAVIRVKLVLPARVFLPYVAEAEIEATDGDIGVARVVVQPFEEP